MAQLFQRDVEHSATPCSRAGGPSVHAVALAASRQAGVYNGHEEGPLLQERQVFPRNGEHEGASDVQLER